MAAEAVALESPQPGEYRAQPGDDTWRAAEHWVLRAHELAGEVRGLWELEDLAGAEAAPIWGFLQRSEKLSYEQQVELRLREAAQPPTAEEQARAAEKEDQELIEGRAKALVRRTGQSIDKCRPVIQRDNWDEINSFIAECDRARAERARVARRALYLSRSRSAPRRLANRSLSRAPRARTRAKRTAVCRTRGSRRCTTNRGSPDDSGGDPEPGSGPLDESTAGSAS